MTEPNLTLFYSPGACSLAPHIVLRETEFPFSLVRVTIADGEHRKPEYLAINPRGRVPALRIGGAVVTENAAILPWLGRQRGLFPAPGTLAAARASEWLAWLSSTVHISFAQIWRAGRFADAAEQHEAIRLSGFAAVREHFAQIESRLGGRYAVDDQYSVVDPYLLVFYRWGGRIGFDMRAQFPGWTSHAERLVERPAVRAALDAEGVDVW